MKKGVILSSLFAIMLFVGTTSAQHIKAFDGRNSSLIIPVVQSSAMPTLDLVAGEPIRLQVAKMRTANNLKQMALAVHTYPAPCEGELFVRKGGGTQQEYMTITLNDVFISATEAGWKGTCRILDVKFKSGKNYQARVRFR
jgi:hypothetical protein